MEIKLTISEELEVFINKHQGNENILDFTMKMIKQGLLNLEAQEINLRWTK